MASLVARLDGIVKGACAERKRVRGIFKWAMGGKLAPLGPRRLNWIVVLLLVGLCMYRLLALPAAMGNLSFGLVAGS